MPNRNKFELKPLSKDGIEQALSKAEHYRLLNQPLLAESICRDIIAVEPDNQKALIYLLLSLADQFGVSKNPKEAMEVASRLKDPYHQKYYGGIIHERQGMASLGSTIPGSNFDAYEWYLEAMEFFEEASAIQPSNMEPIMRWNTCARVIMNFNLKERPRDDIHPMLE